MEIKKEDILHIANLSMIKLDDSELVEYTKSMNDIVGFANTINLVDTSDTEASNFSTDKYNVFREDVIRESIDRKELLKNAPSSNGMAYSLPKMMD